MRSCVKVWVTSKILRACFRICTWSATGSPEGQDDPGAFLVHHLLQPYLMTDSPITHLPIRRLASSFPRALPRPRNGFHSLKGNLPLACPSLPLFQLPHKPVNHPDNMCPPRALRVPYHRIHAAKGNAKPFVICETLVLPQVYESIPPHLLHYIHRDIAMSAWRVGVEA